MGPNVTKNVEPLLELPKLMGVSNGSTTFRKVLQFLKLNLHIAYGPLLPNFHLRYFLKRNEYICAPTHKKTYQPYS
jgi:hypothetical protein